MRAVVRNGQVLERNDYYPYGGRHENPSLAADAANRWRFSGKELQTTAGVNLLDFGARLYDDRLCRWTTRDPMSEKYYGFSPYNYCAGDPVNLVDPEGMTIYVKDYASQRNVLNTLSKADSKHIAFSKTGMVIVNSMHESDSKAFAALKTLSESKVNYNISSSLFYNTKEGIKVFKFGDAYEKGMTLMPNSQVDSSPDDDVYIVTNSLLNEIEQASNLAHEAYGHAYFYDRLLNGEDVSPYHKYVTTYLGSVWDDEAGFYVAINGWIDSNTELATQINSVVNEVILRFQNR